MYICHGDWPVLRRGDRQQCLSRQPAGCRRVRLQTSSQCIVGNLFHLPRHVIGCCVQTRRSSPCQFCLFDAASSLRECFLSSGSGSCLRQRRGRSSVHGRLLSDGTDTNRDVCVFSFWFVLGVRSCWLWRGIFAIRFTNCNGSFLWLRVGRKASSMLPSSSEPTSSGGSGACLKSTYCVVERARICSAAVFAAEALLRPLGLQV